MMNFRILNFSEALEGLKAGAKIYREGWNGKWLELKTPDEHSSLPYLYMNYPSDSKNNPGAKVPWTPSQTDILADDWIIVDDIDAGFSMSTFLRKKYFSKSNCGESMPKPIPDEETKTVECKSKEGGIFFCTVRKDIVFIDFPLSGTLAVKRFLKSGYINKFGNEVWREQ